MVLFFVTLVNLLCVIYCITDKILIFAFYIPLVSLTFSLIFAILFKKPFIAIGNKNRGMARFNSLLQMLNLETRLISSYEDYEQKKATLLQPIDYDNVHHILAAKRNEAIRFIQQALASD